MIQIGIVALTIILYLALLFFAIFIFYHQYKQQSIIHAILGFIIPPYGYIGLLTILLT